MGQVCRTCKAPIVWAVTEQGKRMPVDQHADDAHGNMLLARPYAESGESGLFVFHASAEGAIVEQKLEQLPGRYTSHFATCRYADQHRRKDG